jgi:hypothetical protein
MKPHEMIMTFVVVSLFGMAEAGADTVFSNLGPGGSFGSSSATIQQGILSGYAFTASETATFTSMELAVGSFAADVTGDAYLATDIGGVPGATLASWSFAVPQALGGSLITLPYPTILPPVTLDRGVQYWVYLTDPTPPSPGSTNTFAWFLNSTGQTGPEAFNNAGRWYTGTFTTAAFQIDGTITSVPEPSSIVTSLIGLMIAGGVVRGSRLVGRTDGLAMQRPVD